MSFSLSVIIVNYKSAELIINCIDSAFQFPSAALFEWIVVDNDSKDNSEDLISSKFPFVKWINMGYNAGFARANNEGIRQAQSEIILLLNPDTLILDDAIKKCFDRFINTNYAACSVQLLYLDRKPQITGSYFITGGLNHLLPLPYLGPFIQFVSTPVRKKRTSVVQASIEQKVDRLNGAFMMVRKKAIEGAGLFDEDFFLYAEEVEWCSRLKKVGDIVVYGDLYTIHLQGSSINEATNAEDKTYFNLYDKKGLQLMISKNLRIRKQYGRAWYIAHLLTYTAEVPVYLGASFLHHLFKLQNPFKEIKRIKGYSHNVVQLWKLTPKIISNKPYFYKMF